MGNIIIIFVFDPQVLLLIFPNILCGICKRGQGREVVPFFFFPSDSMSESTKSGTKHIDPNDQVTVAETSN